MTEPNAEPTPDAAPASLPDPRSLIMTSLSLLAAKAWEAMGLVPNPDTKQMERKFDDAQLAIDAIAALAAVIKSRLSDAERREVDTLMANLRINFVEQKGKAT